MFVNAILKVISAIYRALPASASDAGQIRKKKERQRRSAVRTPVHSSIFAMALLAAMCMSGAVLARPVSVASMDSIAVHSMPANGGADLAYLGLDASGQPIYATVSYTDGELNYYTISSDGLQGQGMRIDYFQGKNLGKHIVSETRTSINMPMGNGCPHDRVPRDNFSLRATGVLRVNRSGNYTFITRSDDGVRLYVNGRRVIDEWRGMGTTEFRASVHLIAGQTYKIQLDYFEQGGPGHLELLWLRPGSETPSHLSKAGTLSSTGLLIRETEGIQGAWQAEYFKGTKFEQSKLKRSENFIDHDFNKTSAAPGLPRTKFSARWSGRLKIKTAGQYTFYTTSDDGVRLYVNGELLIDEWRGMAPTEHSGTVTLQGDADVILEYFQGGGGASIQLEWEGPNSARRLLGPAGGFRSVRIESAPFARRIFSAETVPGNLARDQSIRLAILTGGIQSDISILEIQGDGTVSRKGPVSGPSDMQAALQEKGLMYFNGQDLRFLSTQSGLVADQEKALASEEPISVCSSGPVVFATELGIPALDSGSMQRHSIAKALQSEDSGGESVVTASCSAGNIWIMTSSLLYKMSPGGMSQGSIELPDQIRKEQPGNLRGLQFLADSPPTFAYGRYVFRWSGKEVAAFAGQGELSCAVGPTVVCLDSDAGTIWQLKF